MATATTINVYVPKDLYAPLAKYLVDKGLKSTSALVQQALREKLTREGYLPIPA